MPEFKPFSMRAAVSGAIQDASSFTKLQMANETLARNRSVSEIQQSAGSPQEAATRLKEAGFHGEAIKIESDLMGLEKQQFDNQLAMLNVIQESADQVGDQTGYDHFRARMQTLGLMGPDDLPEQYNKEAKNLLQNLSLSSKEMSTLALNERKFQETQRHNLATEKLGADRLKATIEGKDSVFEKKIQVMVDMGLPPNLAKGLASGAVKVIKDGFTQDATFVTVGGGVVGRLEEGEYINLADSEGNPATTLRKFDQQTGKIE